MVWREWEEWGRGRRRVCGLKKGGRAEGARFYLCAIVRKRQCGERLRRCFGGEKGWREGVRAANDEALANCTSVPATVLNCL